MTQPIAKKSRIVWNDIPDLPMKSIQDLDYWYNFVGETASIDFLVMEHAFVKQGKLKNIHSIPLSTNAFERYFETEQYAQEWIDWVSQYANERNWSVTCTIHDA